MTAAERHGALVVTADTLAAVMADGLAMCVICISLDHGIPNDAIGMPCEHCGHPASVAGMDHLLKIGLIVVPASA